LKESLKAFSCLSRSWVGHNGGREVRENLRSNVVRGGDPFPVEEIPAQHTGDHEGQDQRDQADHEAHEKEASKITDHFFECKIKGKKKIFH
jgi:hypothetical protein